MNLFSDSDLVFIWGGKSIGILSWWIQQCDFGTYGQNVIFKSWFAFRPLPTKLSERWSEESARFVNTRFHTVPWNFSLRKSPLSGAQFNSKKIAPEITLKIAPNSPATRKKVSKMPVHTGILSKLGFWCLYWCKYSMHFLQLNWAPESGRECRLATSSLT